MFTVVLLCKSKVPSYKKILSYRSFKHVSEQEFLKGPQGMDFNNISKDEDLDAAYPNFENSIIKN